MRRCLVGFLALVLFSLSGCSFNHAFTNPGKPKFKIGLIADTQITSTQGGYHGGRSRGSDRFIDVAIRPLALESQLAEVTLRTLLSRLQFEGCDFVLYLGDGLNSGATDEADRFFTIIQEFQKNGLPIFVVVGNHDYLGAGNFVSREQRYELINYGWTETEDLFYRAPLTYARPVVNRPLSKYGFIDRIQATNRESFQLLNKVAPGQWQFDDNWKEIRDIGKPSENAAKYDGHEKGIYYAGVLTGPDLNLILADTSDYRDITWRPTAGTKNQFWGGRGSMSYCEKENLKNPSQMHYIEKTIDVHGERPFRIVSSHYSPQDWHLTGHVFGDLSYLNPSRSSRNQVKRLVGFNSVNYWLCAHSHDAILKSESVRGWNYGSAGFMQLKVGSTTDFGQHACIFAPRNVSVTTQQPAQSMIDLDSFVQAKRIDPEFSAEVLGVIHERVKRIDRSQFEAMPIAKIDSQYGYHCLGVTKAYRKIKRDSQKQECQDIAARNIDRLCGLIASSNSGITKQSIKVHLSLLASCFEELSKLDKSLKRKKMKKLEKRYPSLADAIKTAIDFS